MAKINRPLNSEKARGAIGGIIFSETNNVNYVRKNTIKPYVQTEKRKEVANRLALASSGWQRMTDEERNAWEDFAERATRKGTFGERVKNPAFSWYVSSRENLHSVRMNRIPVITNAEFPVQVKGISITERRVGNAWRVLIANTAETVDTNNRLRVYRGKRPSQGASLNISECSFWYPTGTTARQIYWNIPLDQVATLGGYYTFFVQNVNSVSGLASEIIKVDASLQNH